MTEKKRYLRVALVVETDAPGFEVAHHALDHMTSCASWMRLDGHACKVVDNSLRVLPYVKPKRHIRSGAEFEETGNYRLSMRIESPEVDHDMLGGLIEDAAEEVMMDLMDWDPEARLCDVDVLALDKGEE